MWRMLCERGTDLRIEVSEIEADGNRGSARWEAWYTFAGTGRPVHNVIHASFRFRNGLIQEHRDAFDLHRWAGQALGPTGALLGWTPFLQRAIRAQAALALDRHALGRAAGSPPPTRRRMGGCAVLIMAALLLIGLGSVWLLVRIGGTSDGPGALLVYVAAVGGLAGAWIYLRAGTPAPVRRLSRDA